MMNIKEVCLVIIFYNPQNEQIIQAEELSRITNVIVVDNSLIGSNINVSCYLPLFENKGIAAAQNIGLRKAKELGGRFVIFLDQDSKVDKNYIKSIYLEYKKIKSKDPTIGILGPLVVDTNRNIEYKTHTNPDNDFEVVSSIISSGSIVEMETIDRIGPFEESLFIDLVDSEWCWRAKKFGLKTYMTRKVILRHSIGKDYLKIGSVAFTISSPNRYYYQYRNTIRMFGRNYVPLEWKVRIFFRRILDMLIVPFITKKGLESFAFMVKGCVDGLKSVNYVC